MGNNQQECKVNNKTVDIGSFHLESGRLLVTDPCYSLSTWCTGIIDNAKPGKWNVDIERADVPGWGNRNWTIRATHASASHADLVKWSKAEFEVGVDSGQAGFFDLARYPKTRDAQGEYGDKESFYGHACDLTQSLVGAGCLEFGAVSSSGFGDGSYRAYIAKNSLGEAVGVQIFFITEDDFQDEDGE